MRHSAPPSPAARAERRALSTDRAHLSHVNTQAIFIAIAALMSAVLAGPTLGPTLTTAWLVPIVLIAGALALLGRRARRPDLDARRARAASELVTALSAAAGLAWGLIGAAICTAGPMLLKASAMLLVASLLLVAVHTLATRWRAYLIYLLATSVPAAACLLAGSGEDRVLAIVLLLIAIGAGASGYHHARTCHRSAYLELEVEELNGVVLALRDRLSRHQG